MEVPFCRSLLGLKKGCVEMNGEVEVYFCGTVRQESLLNINIEYRLVAKCLAIIGLFA